MSRTTTRSQRLHHLALLTVTVATALTLTACGSGGDTDGKAAHTASASPTPTGVVTAKAAATALDHYENINNQANKTVKTDKAKAGTLLRTVEGGQVNAQSLADYELFTTWTAKKQSYYGSGFTYERRKYLIPQAGSASWFAVQATASGSKNESLIIFDKADGTYKVVAAVYADGKLPIPKAALDKHGLATAIDPAKRVGALAPDQLSTAFEDLAETGGKKTGGKLASTRATKAAVQLYTDRDKDKNSKYATTKYFATDVKARKVYALRLADGGVLTVFPTAHNQETMLRPPYMSSYKIDPNKEEAVYNSSGRVVITDEFQGQALAQLTPSSKPQVIAREYRMVDSR
ncbi:hypothetical protein [Streptomyces sp. NBC_00996]|uniref:hypothetical protein n=1 Tax=Streptomyces sp. NBC_00996 TaxID=2903710 RepID=UPI0038676DC8|nr:hypothetical protein OG390_00780 [Streptomyces sp. NBC_00996]